MNTVNIPIYSQVFSQKENKFSVCVRSDTVRLYKNNVTSPSCAMNHI